jgi:hypothetical protein
MTLATTTQKVQYAGNGSTVAFSVPFQYTSTAEIEAILTSAAGVDSTLTIVTHYTLTSPGASGTLTMLTAPASGELLTIRGVAAITQTVDLTAGGAFSAEVVEGSLDKLTRIAQQLLERIRRAPLFRASSSQVDVTLPEPEAGAVLAWNAAEDDLENKQLADIGVATFPPTSTDNAIPRFDGTGGLNLQGSNITISDGGVMAPTANDGGALGSAALSWADLFLASGGVVNWANGDVTITHSSNQLAFAGAANGYSFDTFLDLAEVATPSSPAANTARLYAIDDGLGGTHLRMKDSAGNVQSLGGRERLTANRTYYVRTDGSDSNTGLANTAGGAFLTIQRAYDVIATTLVLGEYRVTIQVGAGTYSAPGGNSAVLQIFEPWVGGKGSGGSTVNAAVHLKGDEATPANCIISCGTTYGVFVNVPIPSALKISGFKFQGTSDGAAIFNNAPGSKIYFGAVDFGSMGSGFSKHLWVAQSSVIFNLNEEYTISGGAGMHAFCEVGGVVDLELMTATLTGTPAFGTAFVRAESSGVFYSASTWSGAATGKRFQARGGGHIRLYDESFADLGVSALSRLPGNADGEIFPGGSLNEYSGGIVTIASGSLSGSSVDITGIPAHFAQLLLTVSSFSFSGAGASLRIQASDSNGSAFDTTASNYAGLTYSAGASPAALGVASIADPGANTNAADVGFASLVISAYQSPGSRMVNGNSSTTGGGARFHSTQWSGGAAGNLDALRLLASAGTFDGGTYTLRGIY